MVLNSYFDNDFFSPPLPQNYYLEKTSFCTHLQVENDRLTSSRKLFIIIITPYIAYW